MNRVQVHTPHTPRATDVFASYWRFAQERQQVFYRRLRNEPPPWTCDPIIAEHRFTNAFRASDRESQFLIATVIGKDGRGVADTFFRILLFRFFNKASTWDLLERALGDLCVHSFDLERYSQVLEDAILAGTSIFSAAYIMPSRGRGLTARRKHANLLAVLRRMLDDEVPERIFSLDGAMAFRLLRSYPMVGDFLAYQYLTDLGYTRLAHFEESDFVAAGPGAKDGLRKCFSDPAGLNENDLIRWVCDNQEQLAAHSGYSAPTLFGRPLQLIDCQNLFCETDKYARVAHPAALGKSGRTRIKQRYSTSAHIPLPKPKFPTRWGLDQAVGEFYQKAHHGIVRLSV